MRGSDERVVVKFGGVPMASPKGVRASLNMVAQYPGCACVVVSAPGRLGEGAKITDLLISWWVAYSRAEDWSCQAAEVRERFDAITAGLGTASVGGMLDAIERRLSRGICTRTWLVSRGEVLMASIVAGLLGWPTARADRLVRVNPDGSIRNESYDGRKWPQRSFVLPGFIGGCPPAGLILLSRGGSDISGAVAARALGAALYVNAKDVPGVASANPCIVPDARWLGTITYSMMHELSVRGAEVLHPDAVEPVEEAGIPICVRGVLTPDQPGTMIVPEILGDAPVAVTGRRGYVYIEVHERGMNERVGSGQAILAAFSRRCIPFDHIATGQHFMGVAVAEDQAGGQTGSVISEIDSLLSSRTRTYPMATVCIVAGHGRAVRLLGPALVGLAEAGIVPIMVSCTAGGSAIIGVCPERYLESIRIVHSAVAV